MVETIGTTKLVDIRGCATKDNGKGFEGEDTRIDKEASSDDTNRVHEEERTEETEERARGTEPLE